MYDASELEIGEQILSLDGDYGTVEANVTIFDANQRMYNLTVEDAHTFFVGDDDWLIHNCNRDDIVNTSTFVRKTGGRTNIYTRTGNADDALNDFNGLNGIDIKEIDMDKGFAWGILPDKSKAIWRNYSKDGRATLEFQTSGGRPTHKFRYE